MAAAHNGQDSVVLEEEIDPNYSPSMEECVDYGKWLGMSFPEDDDLLWIAREGLKAPLPEHWKPCRTLDTGDIYYFSFADGQSSWDHPCDSYYRNLYEEEKARRNLKQQQWMSKEDSERHRNESDEIRKIVDLQRREGNIDPAVKEKADQLRKTSSDLASARGGSRSGSSLGELNTKKGGASLGASAAGVADFARGSSLNKKSVLPNIAKPLQAANSSASPAPDAGLHTGDRSPTRESTFGSERSAVSDKSRTQPRGAGASSRSLQEPRRDRPGQDEDRRRRSFRNEPPADLVVAPHLRHVDHYDGDDADDDEDEDEDGDELEDDERSRHVRGQRADFARHGPIRAGPKAGVHADHSDDAASDEESGFSDEEDRRHMGAHRHQHRTDQDMNGYPSSKSRRQGSERGLHDRSPTRDEAKEHFDNELDRLHEEHDRKIRQAQDDFHKELEELRLECDTETQRKKHEHERQLQHLQRQFDDYKNNLARQEDDERRRHEQDMDSLQHEHEMLEQELLDKRDALQEENQTLHDDMRSLDVEARQKRKELESLEEHLREYDAQLKDFGSMEQLQSRIDELLDREVANRNSLEDERAHRREVELRLEELQEENAKLASEDRARPATADASTSPQEDAAARGAELKAAREAIETLRARLEAQQADFAQTKEHLHQQVTALEKQEKDRADELERRQQQHQREVAEARAALERARREHAGETRRAQAELEASKAAEAQHASEAAALEDERGRLQQELAAAREKARGSLHKQETLELTLSKAEADARQAQAEKRTIQASLSTAHEARANLETRCRELEALLETARSGDDRDAEASQDVLRDLETKLQASRTELLEERAKARNERNALTEEVETLRFELGRAREYATNTEAESTKARVSLDEKLAAAEARCADLEREIRAVQAAHKENLDDEAETKQLRTALSVAEAAREQAIGDADQLQRELEAARVAFDRERSAMRADLEAATTRTLGENDREDQGAERLEAALRDLGAARDQLGAVKQRHADELAAARSEQDALRRQLESLAATAAADHNQDQEWTWQLQAALREAAELREEKATLKRNLSLAHESRDSSTAQVDALRAELHGALEVSRTLRAESDRLKSAAQNADFSLAERESAQSEETLALQRTIHGLQNSVRKLELERSQARDDAAHAERQRETLEEELERANEVTAEVKRRILSHETTQRQLLSREADLKSQLASLQSELSDVQSELTAQSDRTRALTDKTRRLDKERLAAVAESADLREQIRDLEEAGTVAALSRSQASDVEKQQRRLAAERQQLNDDRLALDKQRRKVEESAKTVKRQLVQLEERFRTRSALRASAARPSKDAETSSRTSSGDSPDHRVSRQETLDAAAAWEKEADGEREAIASARALLSSQRQDLEAQRTRLEEQQEAWQGANGRRSASVDKLGNVLEMQREETTEALLDLAQKLDWLQTLADLHEEISTYAQQCIEDASDAATQDHFFRLLEEYKSDHFLATHSRRRVRDADLEFASLPSDEEHDDEDEDVAFGRGFHPPQGGGDENESMLGNGTRGGSFHGGSRGLGGGAHPRYAAYPSMPSHAYPVYAPAAAHHPLTSNSPFQPLYMAAQPAPGSTVYYVNENGQVLQEAAAPPTIPIPRPRAVRPQQAHVETGYHRVDGGAPSVASYLGHDTRSLSPVPQVPPAREVSVFPEELRLMESRWSEQQALAQGHSQWLLNFRRDLERVSALPSSTMSTSSSGSRRRMLKARHHRRSRAPLLPKHEKHYKAASRRSTRGRSRDTETKI